MQPLGKHFVRVDGDSVYMRSHGMLMLDDLRELHRMFAAIRQEHGALFVFYDARKNTGIDSAARKAALIEHAAEVRADLQVAFGAPFVVRVLIEMIFKAQKLMQKDIIPFYMIETEEKAWEFFDSERDRIRRELVRTKPIV